MKKLVLILAVAFGASMVACSSEAKTEENAAPAEEAVEVVEEVAEVAPVDSAAVDSAAEVATAETPAE